MVPEKPPGLVANDDAGQKLHVQLQCQLLLAALMTAARSLKTKLRTKGPLTRRRLS